MKLPLLPLLALTFAFSVFTSAEAKVTSPKEHFGFNIGDDYHLATYTQTEAYFKKLAAESDRVQLVDMGRTEENRIQWMLVITAPENLKSLARYKDIAQKLARAEGVTDEQARALAAEGKAVVWIDGGLHATETVGTHQLIETAWQLASAKDPEMLRILKDVIVLCTHANPDGQELVSNWYMRDPDPTKRSTSGLPRLYQKYIGHDNNRDFYLSAMSESTNINRQLYLEWFPQVVYNHHQSGPAGTIIFVPPFRDPFNYNFDPMVVVGVETLGNAIQTRFLEEAKAGATSRSGANYSTWWNGGLRTTTYFHNMIGLLTEIVGSPTPMRIPLVAKRQLPSNDLTAPIAPQLWHYRQSIDYSVSANRAVLDHASRHRDRLLYNIYRMGRNSIERGSRDHWTPRPTRIDEIVKLAAADRASGKEPEEPTDTTDTPSTNAPPRLASKFYDVLRKPEWRDPRGYIVPADQPDFPTAVKFINTLVKTGVVLHRATSDFSVAGRHYPAGSYIAKTAQAFRPHVLDMFEPQDHPNDFKFDGGPPNKPYDVAGWTLALQMGVQFDRVLDAFDGPFERLPYGQLQSPPAGRIAGEGSGFAISHRQNDGFILVNRLLKAGAEVYWLKNPPADAPSAGSGAIYVPDRGIARGVVENAAAQLGLDVHAIKTPAAGELIRLTPVRIALWDRYGGSMQSGWTRWLLERFEFPFSVIYAPEIDAGKLREKYDAIVFASGAIPAAGVRPPAVSRPRNLPPGYEAQIGRISPDKSVPALKEFLEAGGTIVTIGSSTNLAYQLGLPLQSALTERSADGKLKNLPDEKFYVPGSVLEARVDTNDPLAWGMPERANFYFEKSAAFTLANPGAAGAVKSVAWFDSDKPLRSGWAWGQKYLKDSVTVATVSVGAGKLHLMGSEVAFRAQPHGTFKLLFNALHLAGARNAAPAANSQQ
ncbi:MAG: M14 family metallopeptidase [Opitutaceae bacterium]|nr:M14 family metallopeptidase [Opitutaceae bacterium]